MILYKLRYKFKIILILILSVILLFILYNFNNFNTIFDKFENINGSQTNEKINISLGLLSYNAPDTLKHTLQTYKDSGLLDISNDIFAVLQKSDKQDEEVKVCENYKIRFIKMPDNGKMASGFKAIYENANNDIVVFLENDFVNYSTKQESIDFFNNSINFIKHQNIDLVRARNRKNAGEPNFGIPMFKHIPQDEFKYNVYLSECVYWIDDPELVYPDQISRIKPLIGNDKWYSSSSKSCGWTNNAFVTSKKFFKEAVLPHLSGSENIEDSFVGIWSKQNYNCVYGPGLFTHFRLDGH
jgi:hypothetical protein